jgi:parvulin-like peptidyl-prolyl isomerase
VRRLSALVVVLLPALLAAGTARAGEAVPTGAVAVVAGEPVPLVGYTDQIARLRRSYALRRKSFPARGTPGFRAIRDAAVALLVFRVEVRQKAADDGIVVSDAAIAARLGQIEQQWGSNPREFRKMLRRLGLTRRALREEVRARLTLEAVRQRLREEQTVSDDEIAGYYESHLRDFTTPSSRRMRHVVLRTRARALDVVRRLRAGARFGAVARRYSVDRGTRRIGGVMTVVAGVGDRALQRYVFSLRQGRLAGPVRFRDGWQVIQALGPVRPQRTAPLAEVSVAVREQVRNGKAGGAMTQWLGALKRDYAGKVSYAKGFGPGDG